MHEQDPDRLTQGSTRGRRRAGHARGHRPLRRTTRGVRPPRGSTNRVTQPWLSLVGAIVLTVAMLGSASTSSKPVEAEMAVTATRAAKSTTTAPSVLDSRERALSRDAERERLGALDRESLKADASRLALARTRELRALRAKAKARSAELRQQTRWVLPVASYRLTGRFGESSSLWSSTHTGLDFAAPDGTQIRSVAAGVVQEAGWAGSYGNRSIVRLNDGTEIWYCHQSQLNVATGERVVPGQPIGTVGSTGNVTGAHLHFEVRPGGGDPVDPYTALTARGLNP